MSNVAKSGSPLLAIGAAFAGIYVIWGTTYLAIAIVIRTIPPFISGAVRFFLAAALMYVWLRARNPRPFQGLNLWLTAICGVLLSGMGNGLVIWAQQGIPSGIAALMVTAVPVLVLVLDWAFFSRQSPSGRALLGIAVAVAGVVIIVSHTRTLSGDAHPLYLLSMFAATLAWSFGTLLQKRVATRDNVLSFTCAQMFFGGIFQLVMSFVDGEWGRFDPDSISLAALIGVAYLVVFGSLIAVNCYLWLLTRVSAQKVTTYALVNPVVALILGALVLDEKITPLAIIAAALVLSGVALVLFQDSKLWSFWRSANRKPLSVTEPRA